jgi:hypothetical protein
MSPTISVSLNALATKCVAQVQAYFTNGTALAGAGITIAWSSSPANTRFAISANGTTSSNGVFTHTSNAFPTTGAFTCIATITRLAMTDSLGTYAILSTATLTAQRVVRTA